jgi:hypothetical protein
VRNTTQFVLTSEESTVSLFTIPKRE